MILSQLGKSLSYFTSPYWRESYSCRQRALRTALRPIMKGLGLLSLTLFTSLASAACNADNCLRGLRATPSKASSFCASYTRTSNTATAIPTYGSFCSNSPSRVSSACSCAVTSPPTPTCSPSAVVNAQTRNGNFEDYPPPGQGVLNIQPPWYFDGRTSENAYGDYKTEPSSSAFGGAVGTVALVQPLPTVY